MVVVDEVQEVVSLVSKKVNWHDYQALLGKVTELRTYAGSSFTLWNAALAFLQFCNRNSFIIYAYKNWLCLENGLAWAWFWPAGA